MQSVAGRLQAKFLRSLDDGATSVEVARVAILLWRNIDAALSPAIGRAGVRVLLRRSLHLMWGVHPWLATCRKHAENETAFDALQSAFASQSAEEAIQGNLALLQAFSDVLASIIGVSLSRQLLLSVSPPRSRFFHEKDPPSYTWSERKSTAYTFQGSASP